ncbi:AI-2 transport protein TqsA [Actinomadura rubteroloni]|uniref:AI-2 transport protein TqsA n=1 Tax=Actinomadura rubteroloni TaxID=1926885 RepID=A0A2P4UJG6_9ACTN|nr:AI-2E family transporter [Actinomadura rubteroloni]POM25181.1 AI-2 transport protein TqsA [Actinomadura rubteroloni]
MADEPLPKHTPNDESGVPAPTPQADDATSAAEAGAEGERVAVGAGGGVRAGDGADASDPGEPAPAAVPLASPKAVAVVGDEVVPDPAHDVEQRKREAGVDQRFPFGRPGAPLAAHPFRFGFTAALGVITAWMLVRSITSAKSVLIMIVVALFLAVGLNPAVERLKRLGLSRGWAVAVVFLGVLLFFAGFVASLIPPLTEQVTKLVQNIPDYITQLQNNRRIADWDRRYHLLEQAQKKISEPGFQTDLLNRLYDAGKVALSGTFQTLTVLILTLYFLSSLPQIKTFAYQLAPRSRRARVALLGDEILERIGGYVAGQFTIAFIAGLTSYVFLEIMGVPYALALALIVAVTDLIPLVGATIGAVIVCLVVFLTGSTYEGIAAVVFYVIYQQVENYLVYPRVMKRTVDVAPAVTIVAALVGGTLLGVVGALIAIPTAAAIALLIREVVLPRQEQQ